MINRAPAAFTAQQAHWRAKVPFRLLAAIPCPFNVSSKPAPRQRLRDGHSVRSAAFRPGPSVRGRGNRLPRKRQRRRGRGLPMGGVVLSALVGCRLLLWRETVG